MTTRKISEQMFYGRKPRDFIAGITSDDSDAETIHSLLHGMASQAHRIEEAARWIRGGLDRVEQSFQKALASGDLASVHLNSLGELQQQAVAYDSAVSAYAALSDQLEKFIERLSNDNS